MVEKCVFVTTQTLEGAEYYPDSAKVRAYKDHFHVTDNMPLTWEGLKD